jgi:nucleotide-binding universal stress UspA family protein
MGSTAERLLRGATTNVLLANGFRDHVPRRLLAALDDAPITPRVVAWTRTLAERFRAEVIGLHVISSAVPSHVLSMDSIQTGQTSYTPLEVRQQHLEAPSHWIQTLIAGGVSPTTSQTEVAFGDAASEIVAAAARYDCDLIVVGRSGAGGVRHRLLGSVVSDVLHRAQCPVFVAVDPERTDTKRR